MKILFANIPQWLPVSPYLSAPLLAGQLKAAGFDACALDLGIEFYNTVLTRDYLKKSLASAKEILHKECNTPSDEYRRNLIKEFFETQSDFADELCEKIEDAVSVFKTEEKFYNPELLFEARDTVTDALKIVSLPFAPARLEFDNYFTDPTMSLDYENLRKHSFDGEHNMFLGWFEERLKTLDLNDVALFGISITDMSQLVAGFTLARLVKEKGVRVTLGGSYISKIKDELKENPEFFTLFCDYLSSGDGELSVVDLAKAVEGSLPFSQVPSLMMCVDGEITETPTAPKLNFDRVSYPDFDSYDFSQYFVPDIVLPIQLSKGCYWGKCTFCDFYASQQSFDIKTAVRAVDEMEYLNARYGCKHFTFVDEAVPPKCYNEIALEILRRGLEVYFYSFVRMESGFTREVLQNLYNAGGRFFMWGYESDSERIMKLINKGIDTSKRREILENAREIGLWNHCTFLLCYPTETDAEFNSTISVIYERCLVNSCSPSNFVLKKKSILTDTADTLGIKNVSENGAFHVSYKYDTDSTVLSMKQVKDKRNAFESEFKRRYADCLWPLTFSDMDYMLLYLSKHGRDYVRDYRLNYKKKYL